MRFEDGIDCVKGIGPKRRQILENMGLKTVKDVVEYYPRDYKDKSVFTKIADMEAGGTYTFVARVSVKPSLSMFGKLKVVTCAVKDETGTLNAVWFNQPYMKNSLEQGRAYIFTGKVGFKYGKLQVESPEWERYTTNSLNQGRIVPVYRLSEGLSQKTFRAVVKSCLDGCEGKLDEYLPEEMLLEEKLEDIYAANVNIHFPQSNDLFYKARERFVFDELLMLQLRLLQLKGDVKKIRAKHVFKNVDYDKALSELGFSLTNAQQRVLDEAVAELKSGSVMNRLIQGDVGSGKTAVAMMLCYIAVNNGTQAAVMVPTDVLANQHYKAFSALFDKLGITCALLTSSVSAKEKRAVREALKSGEIDIAIGTHALIQDSVEFRELSLVITDEQHRFGVRQREKLGSKGEGVHMLVMTATPIPRTLALILYGDLDISAIDELPPGREKISTFAVDTSYYTRLYEFIKKEAASGGQCYIICPMIEEGQNELKSVLAYTDELSEKHLKDLRVSCVHGKMKPAEKAEIMESFAAGEIDVLVATTVIEVGINVPNASLMIIENADRFGLSTLHQLRGRVGRGKRKSTCVLVSDNKGKTAVKRLKAMCETDSGFVLSEKDMELRGPGDFFGTHQHGIPELKIANLYEDTPILARVHQQATKIYKTDPELKTEKNKHLKKRLDEMYSRENEEICL